MSLLLENGQPSGMVIQRPGRKTCPICTSEVSVLKASPTGQGHSEVEHRACGECWEAHLSLQVQDNTAGGVQCMFCPKVLSASEIKDFARTDTKHLYDQKKTDVEKYKCMARCQGPNTSLQDRGNNRVFTCDDCGFGVCLACDLPEHPDETCDDRQTRLKQNQSELEDGFRNSELFSDKNFKDAKLAGYCPKCEMPFTMEKGCGYTQCALGNKMSQIGLVGGCGHRFCSHCFINWTGEASAYLGGRQQHGTVPGSGGKMCPYFTKTSESTHTLKHRFENLTEEQLKATLSQELLDGFEDGREVAREKDRKAAERREKKRARDESGESGPAKKSKTRSE